MAKHNPTDRAQRGPLSPDPKGKKVERAVLALLIYRYPERLTAPTLSRVLNAEESDFNSEKAIEQAVHELVGAGLLEWRAEFVVPTRATLYFDALDSD